MNIWPSRERLEFPQRVVVTAIAVLIAWTLGESFHLSSGVAASIITLITLRISLQASITEGFVQVLATLVGTSMTLLLDSWYKNSYLTVLISTVLAFILGKLSGLGEGGIINIAVTSLIIAGPGNPENNAVSRIIATLMGVGVAVIFSFWVHPSSPIGRVRNKLNQIYGEYGNILHSLADIIIGSDTEMEISTLLERSRILADEIVVLREGSEESVRYAKWSPLASKKIANRLHREVISTEHSIVQLRGITRSFYDREQDGSKIVKDYILYKILYSLSILYKSSQFNQDSVSNFDDIVILDLKDKLNELKNIIIEQETTDYSVFQSYLYVTLDRLVDTFDIDNPAVKNVDTPITKLTPLESIASRFKNLE